MDMNQLKFSSLLACTICAVLATTAFADDLTSRTPPVMASAASGIALRDGGVLYGQLLDAQQRPLAKQEVRVLSQGHLVIAVKTNAQGQFGVKGLRGGPHTIESTNSRQTVLLWAPRTAPPSADRIAVMVAGQDSISRDPVVRGQLGGGDYGPAIRGAVAGGLVTGLTYWALDYNPSGS
jgi:hypothetical protein